MLASKREVPWTDEEPQTNAKNAYVCATRFLSYSTATRDFPGARRYSYEERQARHELHQLREKYNLDDSESNGCS